MTETTELEKFIALSRVLTGEEELNETLADQYLKRLKDEYSAQLQGILDAFSAIAAGTSSPSSAIFEIRKGILDNKDMQSAARQIISIWYTAEFVGKDGSAKGGTQAQYYSGLLWKVIKAHPPTFSTEGYGYWQTPPTELPLSSREDYRDE